MTLVPPPTSHVSGSHTVSLQLRGATERANAPRSARRPAHTCTIYISVLIKPYTSGYAHTSRFTFRHNSTQIIRRHSDAICAPRLALPPSRPRPTTAYRRCRASEHNLLLQHQRRQTDRSRALGDSHTEEQAKDGTGALGVPLETVAGGEMLL